MSKRENKEGIQGEWRSGKARTGKEGSGRERKKGCEAGQKERSKKVRRRHQVYRKRRRGR